jgi:hypothetical protein
MRPESTEAREQQVESAQKPQPTERAVYVRPTFRVLEVVTTRNNPGPGGDFGTGGAAAS